MVKSMDKYTQIEMIEKARRCLDRASSSINEAFSIMDGSPSDREGAYVAGRLEMYADQISDEASELVELMDDLKAELETESADL